MKLKLKLISVGCFLLFTLTLCIRFMPIRLFISNSLSIMKKQSPIWVQIHRSEGLDKLELEAYLMGVVASEMPASFELEALKAQAVASRSFVASRAFSVDDTTASQVYKDEATLKQQWQDQYETNIQKIREAVTATQGLVLKFQGEVINATFFSSSNGKTNNAQDYWVSGKPYLISVDSPWDNVEKNDNIRTASFSYDEMQARLGTLDLEIVSWYENGYVKEVLANQTLYSGREIREIFGLSSSSFSIAFDEDGILFETVGSGHGVGMSQYGALGMAKEGYGYEEILKHYYQGAEITKI